MEVEVHPIPRTFLFGNHTVAVAKSGLGHFGHTFGGPHDRQGMSRTECNGLLIHLLHRLDLTDPAIPISIPGIRWLPLYYCFDFRANEIGYRLNSDEFLRVYLRGDDPNVTAEEEWPDEEFPAEFPKSDIAVERYGYDPTDLEDAYAWAGVFGIGKLSEADQIAAKNRVSQEAEELGLYAPESEEEFDGALSSPFAQGKPKGKCPNPDCENRAAEGKLSTIALVPAEPVPGVQMFGLLGGGVKLIFQICPRCYTIRASNECG